ncbi:hypothetical protein HF1_03620 [Mycoplasma haemofelis str. Langford 1]|uniref:Uncharacterized protein n=1 Tax=Mycoplasma haemofelis (strain Langford 1) TaxID=941640 RepID=E8ZGU9_MYCHL|nr:hypothetical protein [Mycoplasma haemofelis]CBY92370.1 hypothetical protein HF1_03620 [Mycoplasma haemofelis str. Langford 1]
MGKGAFAALGTAGGLGAGGLIALKPWQSTPDEAPITSIRSKYPSALLNLEGDVNIWEKKYKALETKTPHHPTLQKALSTGKGAEANLTEAKSLLKSGCRAIYESDSDNSNNFQDFKSFCSKTNEDATKSGKQWIADATSKADGNKWDTVLTSLKGHSTWSLDSVLETLKKGIQGDSSSFPEARRKELKDLCDKAKLEVFVGESSSEFQSQEAFCKAD